jgi:DNA-binding MarR family transcriptional regulator
MKPKHTMEKLLAEGFKLPLIDELAYFLDLAGWFQSRALHVRDPNLELIHLAFMRRAARNGRVSFSDMVTDTGFSKVFVSRAALFLEEAKLAKVKPDPKDKRRRHLYLTKQGVTRLNYIESIIATNIARAVEITHPAPKEGPTPLQEFVKHFWVMNNFLPVTLVANPKTHVGFGD